MNNYKTDVNQSAYSEVCRVLDKYVNTEMSGVDDDGSLWFEFKSGATYHVVRNDDGDLDIYDRHYSDLESLVDTVEIYPINSDESNWTADVLIEWFLSNECD